MAISRQFEYCTSDESGQPGLRPLWFEGADPVAGAVVAHDMLEHFLVQASPAEGECMAVGAYLLLRLPFSSVGTLVSGMAPPMGGDVLGILGDICENGYPVPRPVGTRPLADADAERLLQKAVDYAFQELPEELRSYGWGEAGAQEELDEQIQRLISARQAFVDWIRRGWRKAQRRYRHVDPYTVGVELFYRVARLADDLMASQLLWEGALVRITADPLQVRAWAKVQDPQDQHWIDAEMLI